MPGDLWKSGVSKQVFPADIIIACGTVYAVTVSHPCCLSHMTTVAAAATYSCTSSELAKLAESNKQL